MSSMRTRSFLLLVLVFGFSSSALYSQVDLDDGLTLFYPFNDGLLTDESGNGMDGTPSPGFPLTSDSSLVLLNDFGVVYVTIPIDALLGFTDFSVSTQVNYNTLHFEGTTKNGANGIVSGASVDSPDGNDFLITYRIWDESFVIVLDNTNYYFTDVLLAENTWYCLSVIRESGVLRLFLDGEQHETEYLTPNVPVAVSENGLLIGQEQDCVGGCFDPAQTLDGEIDNLRFYNRALSEEEQLLYCECPGLAVGDSCQIISQVSDVELDSKLSVFPNPTNDLIHLRSSGPAILEVQLFDSAGKQMFDQIYPDGTNTIELVLSNYSSGLCFLKIITVSGVSVKPVLIIPDR